MNILFQNGRIIDGLGNVIEHGWIFIERQDIMGVGPIDRLPQDIKDRVKANDTIDLSGKTLLPGLIDWKNLASGSY